MGFIKKDYKIKNLGITIPEAYAQIEDLHVDLDGECSVTFKIQTARENMQKPALEFQFERLTIDKNKPIHEQAYKRAKETLFFDWEDDIVDTGGENDGN